MDLRGYGDRMQTAGEFTVDEVAADALAVADDLGWDRFSMVGHSMGAKFAHRVLLQAPDRVRALVGLNPVPAGRRPSTNRAGRCSPARRRIPATVPRSSTSPPGTS